jgi:hypothetical protein
MFCKTLRHILACLFALCALPLLSQTQAVCTFTFFSVLGFESTFAQGVNRYGNAVGFACGSETPAGCKQTGLHSLRERHDEDPAGA